jgi:small GTP-binding protein
MLSTYYDYRHKCLVIGDSETGKTSLINRFVNNIFYEEHILLIRNDFEAKSINFRDKNHRFIIFDNWSKVIIKPSLFRNMDVIIICYDITNRKSFTNIDEWLKKSKLSINKNTCIILCGNKSDLETERQVDKNEAVNYADKNNMCFIESSAKNNLNIEEIFEYIAKNKINRYHETNENNCVII